MSGGVRALEIGVYAEAAEWLREKDAAARAATLAEVVELGHALAPPAEVDAEPTPREARAALERGRRR